MATAVGFVGLGVMGASIARHLLEKAGNLAVYDVRGAAVEELAAGGATPCQTPAEVAALAEIVGASLPDPAALIEVVSGTNGILSAPTPRVHTFIDFSTSGPVAAREAADLLAAGGIRYVDAPVSGGPAGARDGTLTLMIGAPPGLLEETRPLLEAIGTTILSVGDEPGMGQLAKVINNLLGGAAIATVSEALCIGVKGGIEVGRLLEVINASSGRSGVTQTLFPSQVVNRNFNLGFRLRLEAKDVALAIEEGNRQKVPMLVSSAVHQFWSIANQWGSDTDDFTAVAKMVEGWAGVTLEQGD